MVDEIGRALDWFEAEEEIGAIVLTGNDKAFAAGADIKEMADKNFVQAYLGDFITKGWEAVSRVRKPVIGAVAGYCLGAGLRDGDDVRFHPGRRHRQIRAARKSRWASFRAPAAPSA